MNRTTFSISILSFFLLGGGGGKGCFPSPLWFVLVPRKMVPRKKQKKNKDFFFVARVGLLVGDLNTPANTESVCK